MASDKNNIDDESSCDDDSSSSSSSSTDYTKSQPQDDATAIRENAVRLLESSASKHGDGTRKNSNNNTISKINNNISYQSYQDTPTVTTPNTAAIPTSATPQWGGNNSNNVGTTSIEEGSNVGLSMTEVASMAFNCVGTCLIETYRAASNYYNDYEQQQTPSISDIMNSRTHNYEQVSGYHHNTSFKNGNERNGYTDESDKNNSGEVMDRGGQSTQYVSNNNEQAASQSSGEQSVQIPSTYQNNK